MPTDIHPATYAVAGTLHTYDSDERYAGGYDVRPCARSILVDLKGDDTKVELTFFADGSFTFIATRDGDVVVHLVL